MEGSSTQQRGMEEAPQNGGGTTRNSHFLYMPMNEWNE